MDIRVEKTQAAIKNAFLEIRAKKPIERITIKELCASAKINKSTFYSHYDDIYDLSEKMQVEMVSDVMNIIANDPEFTVVNSAAFVRSLFHALSTKMALISILFSGREQACLIDRLAEGIRELVFREYPEFRNDIQKQLLLTYTIYGGYYAYQSCPMEDRASSVRSLERISETLQPLYSAN